ncbi:hypothetical protein G6F58_013787 [Rhizopus delemar]|nr:hypothetical protein G6F58_013787 [Rhizopus delemar]
MGGILHQLPNGGAGRIGILLRFRRGVQAAAGKEGPVRRAARQSVRGCQTGQGQRRIRLARGVLGGGAQ